MHKCLYASLILIALGIALHISLPIIIHDEINRKMKLIQGSTLYDLWSACRSGNIVEFYLFTVTNVQEFMNGSKPIVRQVGPYTYEQSTCKNKVDVFSQNGSVKYSDNNSFKFLPERSVGLESDNLTVLNIGYVAIASKVWKNFFLTEMLKFFIKSYYDSQLFWNKTVFEMIWGYEDPVLNVINNFVPVTTIIGLYAKKNNSNGPIFEVNDGIQDTTKIGQIITFNGHLEMSVWETPLANRINGSDGSLFSPFLKSASTIYVFSADICRSLQFQSAKEPNVVYINSIPSRKFSLSKATFLSPEEYPDNRGFCLDYPNCPKSGIIDMRSCIKDSPVAISLPHFYGADQSYRDALVGMNPRDDMDISLYIEPQTGVILQVHQPIQVNAIVQRNSHFPELAHLKNITYLPIGYINTSIIVAESVTQTLMSTLIIPQISIGVMASLLIVGALMSVAVIVGILLYRRRYPFRQVVTEVEENAPLIAECPPHSLEASTSESCPSVCIPPFKQSAVGDEQDKVERT